MGRKKGRFADIPINPKGQSGMLQKVSKKTTVIVWTGIIFLLLFAEMYVLSGLAGAKQLETTMYLNQYRLGSKTLTASVQSYAVTGRQEYYDAYWKELNEDKNRDTAWEGLQGSRLKADEWNVLETIAGLSDGLVPLEEAAMESVKAGDLKTAQEAVFGEDYQAAAAQINSLTDECISQIQARLERQTGRIEIIMIISLLAFTMSFAAIIQQIKGIMNFSRKELLVPVIKMSGLLEQLAEGNFDCETDMYEDESEVGRMVAAVNSMNRNYTRMISEIADVLGNMGNGNYRTVLKEEYVGEFAAIKSSILKIAEDTRHTLDGIRTISDEIGSGSEQLANAASGLAEDCTVQAAKVSEISEAISRMAHVMDEEVSGAADAVRLSTSAGEVLGMTNQEMQELKAAIGEINQCSDQIRAIIGVIEDIAGQTNLLSLNASIEAARAGEAGKGFAVVAQQVKLLAEQSTQAAGETRKLIEDTVQAVEKGMLISDGVAAKMDGVMSGAREATEKMSAMADMMKQQSEVMQGINESVSKITEIVDSNSAASQETAAVSEEQTAQVQTMIQMMEQFEI